MESATLRVFVEAIDGPPPGGLSVWHATGNNDLELRAADFENLAYMDTGLEIALPGRFCDRL